MDKLRGTTTMTSSETTLKNSDFFDEPSSTSNVSNLRSDVGGPRRSSRSESGTVINKITSAQKKRGSRVSQLNDSKGDMYQQANKGSLTRFSSDIVVDTLPVDMTKSVERVTDIIDTDWTPNEDGQERERRQTKTSQLDPSLLIENPLIQGNGHVQQNINDCPPVNINVVKVGIYGWRKKFLYLLILFITLLVFINAALLYWIVTLLNINQDGIGNLKIDPNLLILNGDTLIGGHLFAKSIRSQTSNRIKIKASDLISIHGQDDEEDGNVKRKERDANETRFRNESIMSMDGKSIEVIAEQFVIRSGSDRSIVFLVDTNQVLVASDTLRINNSMAIQLNKSLVTPSIRGLVSNDLNIISPTRLIHLSAPKAVQVQSSTGMIQLNSLLGIKFESSRKGKIVLDSGEIHLKNIPLLDSKRPSSSTTPVTPRRGKREEEEKSDDDQNSGTEEATTAGTNGAGDVTTITYQLTTSSSPSRTSIQDQKQEEDLSDLLVEEEEGHDKEQSGSGYGEEDIAAAALIVDEDMKNVLAKEEEEKNEVYQLCICSKNGRIFMAPSDSSCSPTTTTTSDDNDGNDINLICS